MIGKQITEVITGDAAIVALIGNRVYPMSSSAQGLPSVYYNVGVAPHYNSNGQQMQDWDVEILTMCKTYKDSWELTKLILKAINHQRRRKVAGVTFHECRCNYIKDDYEFNIQSFGQLMKFSIKTSNIL